MKQSLNRSILYNSSMEKKVKKINRFLYWAPRIFTIINILFMGLLSLDVFMEKAPLLEMIGGFFIHLIPSFLLIILLVIAWKLELIGGIVFIIISLLGFIYINGTLLFRITSPLVLPQFIIGILFIVNWILKKK